MTTPQDTPVDQVAKAIDEGFITLAAMMLYPDCGGSEEVAMKRAVDRAVRLRDRVREAIR